MFYATSHVLCNATESLHAFVQNISRTVYKLYYFRDQIIGTLVVFALFQMILL